ncbi:hypothetical protein GRF29_106g1594149 [Pseudopithomyces chartarum]|uniref:F-box domain-containing protein n=1 Tax=Pseudopithomyces chartarum TaxID=1892770 RepID=A0AAN6LXK8_9PLEO|nr:hypothetical protein GRF29_106g1594149 [Pseudopithomyces chartarum]
MDRNMPSTNTAFNKLPIELNQRIPSFLSDHKDIANYSLICRKTDHAINDNKFSFWCAKYCDDFVLPGGRTNTQLTNTQLRHGYKYRWQWINKFIKGGFYFRHGNTVAETAILNVLKELIAESFANGTHLLDDDGQLQCLNMIRLKEFVMNSKLFLNGGKRPPLLGPNETHDASLSAVRIMLSHFLLDGPRRPGTWFALDDAQKAVYAATNSAPIFTGPNRDVVNMEWILHCMNFFKFYMTSPDEKLFDLLEDDFGPSKRPTPWCEPLKSGTYPLTTRWYGTYSFMDHHPLALFRARTTMPRCGPHIFDHNVGEGKVQSLTLDFNPPASLPWPRSFEHRLRSRRVTDPNSAFPDLRFDGKGNDIDDPFFATGWLNALPPQCGIPGWQRISFMKHFEEDLSVVGQDDLWAYEGVVVPGGRMILGRWWYASDEDLDFDGEYGGPFVLWAVDGEDEEENGEVDGGEEE